MLRSFYIPVQIAMLAALLSPGAFAEHRYVVQVNGDVNDLAQRHGLTVERALSGSASGYYVLSSQGVAPQAVVQDLSTDPAVVSAEVDKPVRLPGKDKAGAPLTDGSDAATSLSSTLVPYYNSDASSAYVEQPATDIINMDRAHDLATGLGISVATIDTGADFTHPVLQNSLVPGWDFVHNTPTGQEQADLNQETTPILDQETTPILDQETTPILDGGTAVLLQQETTPILDQETTPILDGTQYPAYGHGTMVAGLIHLVAPNATIMPVRAFGADGSASIAQIVEAIHYAVDQQVSVINMSFSLKQDSPSLRAALDYAAANDVICVASAGNDGQAIQVWPAAYRSVIGVAATDNFMVRAKFSNYGSPTVTIAAPGAGVITTYPSGLYAQVWGTSFSAPLVSGAAALLAGMSGDWIEPDTVAAELSHAKQIGQELGAGELDLYQACVAARRRDD